MPRDKDLKRIVRKRMQKTGEAYTTARRQVLSKSPRTKPPAPATPAEVAPDYAAIAGKSDAAVKAKTNRDWAEWVHALDRLDAHQRTHSEIARIVHEEFDTPSWWTQTVTVGYERIKGLRDVGQRRSGEYEANKSKTFQVPVTVLFDAWANQTLRRRWLAEADPLVRTANRPRSMRLGMSDGTVVVLGFLAKGDARSVVAVQHTKLPDRAAADRMKAFWSRQLDALAGFLDSKSRRAR